MSYALGPAFFMKEDFQRFPRSEFEYRLRRLRDAMRACSVDAMLLDDCEILAYFTGYETSLNTYRACIVPAEGHPVMILRMLDVAPFRELAWFDDHVAFRDSEEPAAKVAEALSALSLERGAIGFDPSSHALSVTYYERLRSHLPRARFVGLAGMPWELRIIKSPAEISRIVRAAAILDRVLGDVIASIVPGTTARRLAAIAARRLLELGADPAHLGYISAANGWDFLHKPLDDRPLSYGDVVHLELVARFHGYEARQMRCVVMGPVDARRQQAAETLLKLQDAQIAAMKSGAKARDIDAILRNGVIAAGLRTDYPNITGYTLGYYSRLPIRSSDFTRTFSPSATWHLAAGMVFHMYASADGVSFSETVLVHDDGAERLTKMDRRLFSRS